MPTAWCVGCVENMSLATTENITFLQTLLAGGNASDWFKILTKYSSEGIPHWQLVQSRMRSQKASKIQQVLKLQILFKKYTVGNLLQ